MVRGRPSQIATLNRNGPYITVAPTSLATFLTDRDEFMGSCGIFYSFKFRFSFQPLLAILTDTDLVSLYDRELRSITISLYLNSVIVNQRAKYLGHRLYC